MLNKEHILKSGKTKIRKRDFKEITRQETNRRIDEKNFVIEYFDVVLFMKQNQRRKKNKERDTKKEPQESKKGRQEGRKKKRPRERQRKRK